METILGSSTIIIRILRNFNIPKISRDNGKAENYMADYAYFIEDNEYNYKLFYEINKMDIEENDVYIDTEDSKEELEKLLEDIDYQDRLLVLSVADLSSTALGLLDILSDLQDKCVILKSITEQYLDCHNYYTVFQNFIDITKHYTEKKRQQGYQKAKEKGIVGRPPKTTEIEQAIKLYKTKAFTIAEIEQMTKISKSSLYRYLKDIDREE